MNLPNPLRCLSVRQPFAWAICANLKTVENRSRSTPYRGRIAIHASLSRDNLNGLVGTRLDQHLARGAIVGLVELVDVVPLNAQLQANPWAQGPECWLMAKGCLLKEPIPLKGKLNLFQLEEHVRDRVSQAATYEVDPEDSAVNELAEFVNRFVNGAMGVELDEELDEVRFRPPQDVDSISYYGSIDVHRDWDLEG